MPGDLGPPERERERTRRLKVPSRGGVVIVRAGCVSEASVVEGGREPDQAPLASAREPRTASPAGSPLLSSSERACALDRLLRGRPLSPEQAR